MQENKIQNDIFNEIFSDSPLEHLVKILPQLSPSALQNALDSLFAEYSAMSLIIEDNALEGKMREYLDDSRIANAKQDLAIRAMSEILSQGD